MRLLHIDSSITGPQSVSRQVSASIVNRFDSMVQNLEIVTRDLSANPAPQHTEALLAEKFAAGSNPEHVPSADLSAANAILEDFLAADVIVIGAPMYNFGISTQLKSWIDCLAAPGRTFRYTASGPEGLCGEKRVIVASARGGVYTPPSPIAGIDHQETFLKAFFAFIGVTDIEFVRAEGVALGPEPRQKALDNAITEAGSLAVA